jgi:hypothetical protein
MQQASRADDLELAAPGSFSTGALLGQIEARDRLVRAYVACRIATPF